MARFRRKRKTIGKLGVKKAGTVLSTIGNSTAPAEQVILLTEAGPRNVTGANQDITAERDTGNKCNVGDVCKYVNLTLEVGPRPDIVNESERTGWLEWAFVCVKESETNVPITTVGVQTLGVICTNMFRNECIYTGAVPVSPFQPVVANISLKIPSTKCDIRVGDEWRFITSFRSVNAASGSTTHIRLVKSFNYKAYQ